MILFANLMDFKLISELAELIQQEGSKSVALQMPDEMLGESADICMMLSDLLNKDLTNEQEEILVYVLADT